MRGFARAQAEYEAREPETTPLLAGQIETYLADGIHDGLEVEIDYELDGELTIYEVVAIDTREEIDPNEITGRDRERIIEAIIENYEWER